MCRHTQAFTVSHDTRMKECVGIWQKHTNTTANEILTGITVQVTINRLVVMNSINYFEYFLKKKKVKIL